MQEEISSDFDKLNLQKSKIIDEPYSYISQCVNQMITQFEDGSIDQV